MPQRDYDALARQHHGVAVDDYDALAGQYGGTGVPVPTPAPAPPKEPSYLETTSQAINDFAEGAGAGVWSTLYGTGKLLGYDSPFLKKMGTPPESKAGKAGYFAEQAGEFFLPGLAISKGAKVLQAAPKAAQIAARGTLEAAGAGGVTALQTGGDPEAIRNAAIAGGALSVGGGVVGAGMRAYAPRLTEKAVEGYGRVLNPTKIKTKAEARKIIPELIQRGEWSTTLPRFLTRAEDRLRVLGAQIDDAWDQMQQQGAMADIAPLLKRLADTSKQHYFIENAEGQLVPLTTGPAPQAFKVVQDIAENLYNTSTVNPATGAREIPVRALREFRQYWDDIADKSGAFHKKYKDLADYAVGRAHFYAGNAVRAELAAANPNRAAINKEFSFWQKVADITDETIQRRVGQQKPLSRRLAQLTGALAGKDGLVSLLGAYGMDQLQGLVSSPAWGTVSAVTKDRLATAIGQGQAAQARFYLAQALKAAGMVALTRPTESGAKTPALPPAR